MAKQRRRLNPASSTKKPVIAAVTSVALVAAGMFGGNEILKTQDVSGGEIKVTSSTASLSSGTSVIVDDPAVATQGEGDAARTVKEFTRDEEFSVFGLTWQGDRDIVAFVRAERPDGSWSEWYRMDPAGGPADAARNGTDPIYIEPTRKVQISTGNVDLVENGELNIPGRDVTNQGDIPAVPAANVPQTAPQQDPTPMEEFTQNLSDTAGVVSLIGDAVNRALPTNHGGIAPVAEVQEAPAPEVPALEAPAQEAPAEAAPAEAAPAPQPAVTTASDLEAVFLDGGEGTLDGTIAPAQYNANGLPRVISRAAWGAAPARGTNYMEPVRAVTVHHTAGSNNYSLSEAPGIMRSMQAYHQGLGWQDLGYHAVVDKYGNIYEGRAGGLDRGPQGAHVAGFNNNTWGVSMIGNYMTATPTPQAVNAMGEIIGWKAAVSNFDPSGSLQMTSDSNWSGTKYPAGSTGTFQRVNAHRDFHYNDCPGDNLYSQMGRVRSVAKAKYDSVRAGKIFTPPTTSQSTSTSQSTKPSTTPSTTTSKGTVTNSDGTTTTINNVANTSSKVSFEGILSGDPQAIAAAVGTVAGAVLLYAAANDKLPKQVTQVANFELLPGMTLSSLRPHIGQIVKLTGNQEAANAWNKVDPILGQLDGVLAGVGGDEYAFFEKGIAMLSSDGNMVIMPEKIADVWLKQGLDLGPLGKPVKSDAAANDGDVRIDFERGSITYFAKTGNLDVSVDR